MISNQNILSRLLSEDAIQKGMASLDICLDSWLLKNGSQLLEQPEKVYFGPINSIALFESKQTSILDQLENLEFRIRLIDSKESREYLLCYGIGRLMQWYCRKLSPIIYREKLSDGVVTDWKDMRRVSSPIHCKIQAIIYSSLSTLVSVCHLLGAYYRCLDEQQSTSSDDDDEYSVSAASISQETMFQMD